MCLRLRDLSFEETLESLGIIVGEKFGFMKLHWGLCSHWAPPCTSLLYSTSLPHKRLSVQKMQFISTAQCLHMSPHMAHAHGPKTRRPGCALVPLHTKAAILWGLGREASRELPGQEAQHIHSPTFLKLNKKVSTWKGCSIHRWWMGWM